MATTTNYGWTTPDDTALVKDGAAAIRTLGSSVDTTTKNLNPETTLGDIAYRSSTANVKTRLGIGTTGQVLTVAGGVPSWATASAGGLTLINSGGTTLTGSTVTFSSIANTYKHLQIVVINPNPTNNGATFMMRINGNTSTTYAFDLSTTNITSFSQNNITLNVALNGTTAEGLTVVNLYDYANATTFKMGNVLSINNDYLTATSINYSFTAFAHNQTAAITSVSLFTSSSGTWDSGTAFLYGVS
jgi:hypothetical protein